MADVNSIFPILKNQTNAIRNIKDKILQKGDTWYLIANEWFEQWKKFVGFNSWEKSRSGDDALYPGPIDNSFILDGNGSDIKSHLIGGLDYVLLPQEGWDLLYEWYGLADKQKPIYRKVVEYGLSAKYCKVEVYLLKYKLKLKSNIPADRQTLLWNKLPTGHFERLDNEENTIQDVGLDYPDRIILTEQSNEDGSYPRQLRKSVKPETTRIVNNRGSTSSEDTYMCKICLELKTLVAFIPCGHSLACPACAEKLKACPLCRGFIQSAVRLYFG